MNTIRYSFLVLPAKAVDISSKIKQFRIILDKIYFSILSLKNFKKSEFLIFFFEFSRYLPTLRSLYIGRENIYMGSTGGARELLFCLFNRRHISLENIVLGAQNEKNELKMYICIHGDSRMGKTRKFRRNVEYT